MLYSSNDLLCLDLDGNLQWLRGLTLDYPNASNSLGMSSSPIVVDGVLVVQVENDSESFAAGINVRTGENLWKLDRPKGANWTSPPLPRPVANGSPFSNPARAFTRSIRGPAKRHGISAAVPQRFRPMRLAPTERSMFRPTASPP